MLIAAIFQSSIAQKAEVVDKMSNSGSNKFYLTNKAPLQNQYFVKLPVTSIKPGGWVRKALKLQREGLQLPIELQVRKWEKNKNSVSVNYGPLTYSLNIQENYGTER